VRGQDTSIGAGYTTFARTQWGKIESLRSSDPKAAREILEELAKTYWRPVYKYIRVAWRKSNEEAKDITQEFFANVFNPQFLSRADPARGTFRTFLLASLKNFLRDYQKYKSAQKRGGGVKVLSLTATDEDAPAENSDPEREFNRSWAQQVLEDSLAELERNCASRGREKVFLVLKEYCLASGDGLKPGYKDLATTMGLAVSDVTNYLFEARRELKRILEAKISSYTASGHGVEEELRSLFEG
jgi:RNA polymerase sigma-70 factor (ECF subfamily)